MRRTLTEIFPRAFFAKRCIINAEKHWGVFELLRVSFPADCDVQLAESNFQTRSKEDRKRQSFETNRTIVSAGGMRIGEAQEIYREQIRVYQKEKVSVSKQLENLRRRMEVHPAAKEQCEAEAATLELTLDALKEKQEEYQDYLGDLAEQYCVYWNAAAPEQQANTAADYAVKMAKIMEVARRIMRGAVVPAADEKKVNGIQ